MGLTCVCRRLCVADVQSNVAPRNDHTAANAVAPHTTRPVDHTTTAIAASDKGPFIIIDIAIRSIRSAFWSWPYRASLTDSIHFAMPTTRTTLAVEGDKPHISTLKQIMQNAKTAVIRRSPR